MGGPGSEGISVCTTYSQAGQRRAGQLPKDRIGVPGSEPIQERRGHFQAGQICTGQRPRHLAATAVAATETTPEEYVFPRRKDGIIGSCLKRTSKYQSTGLVLTYNKKKEKQAGFTITRRTAILALLSATIASRSSKRPIFGPPSPSHLSRYTFRGGFGTTARF